MDPYPATDSVFTATVFLFCHSIPVLERQYIIVSVLVTCSMCICRQSALCCIFEVISAVLSMTVAVILSVLWCVGRRYCYKYISPNILVYVGKISRSLVVF